MNDKLTIQELAAYLPYGVKFMPTHFNIEKKSDTLYYLTTIHNSDEFGVNGYTSKYIKPILYPLSSLTKEIEHKGEKFVPLLKLVDPDNTDLAKMRVESYNPFPQVGLQHDYYRVIHEKLGEIISINPRNIKVLPYHLIEKLLEWKFDIFGLLDRSLAVDKTTIQ